MCFLVLFGMFLVRMRPCCPKKILFHVWCPNQSAGSGVLFVHFSMARFFRLSWIMIDFFYRSLKTWETCVAPVLTPLPPKRGFHHFCPCLLSKCIEDKDKQKNPSVQMQQERTLPQAEHTYLKIWFRESASNIGKTASETKVRPPPSPNHENDV